MRRCHRKLCDNLEMALKPDNVELMRVTTATLVHYLVEATWITDDVSSRVCSSLCVYCTVSLPNLKVLSLVGDCLYNCVKS